MKKRAVVRLVLLFTLIGDEATVSHNHLLMAVVSSVLLT